ncbi:MAG: ribosome maturation factor RimM [Halioglobus sp.]
MNLSAQASSLAVGKITGSYGIKGWVKIHAFTEQRESFVQLGKWYIRQSQSGNESIEAIPFDEFKLHGKGLVAHITGVDDRTEAETYKGLELVAGPDALPTLEDGDFYWHQLEGLKVWCTERDERVLLGIVDHLIETGANDVLVIRPCEGSPSDQPKERLVPYLPGSTVKNVDLALGTIEIDWFLEED